MRTNFKIPQLIRLALGLALFIVLLAGERTAAAATTNVILTAIGGGGERDLPAGDFTAVSVCGTGVVTGSDDRPLSELRFALEFDLSSIPPGSLIHTANLRLRTSRGNRAGATAIYGYAGNGVIEIGDMTAGSLVTTHTPTTSAAEFIDVTTFIVERLSKSDHWAGFAMRQEPLGSDFGFWDCPDNTVPPQLTVEYSAPDSTPPVIMPSVVGTLGANGWYVSNVTVSWSVTDAESSITSQNGCDATTITSDTAATTLTCTASSAGGPASQSITVKRDATLPAISAAAASAPNAAGWYNGDVTVQFTCSDALSGIPDGACPPDEVLSAEGASVSSTAQTVTDTAGNSSASSNVVTVQIDQSAPLVAVTGVIDDASYPLGSAPAPVCTTSDALSGVAVEAGLSISGGDADGTGSFTVTCSGAMDNAGNQQAVPVVVHYTVQAAPENLPVVILGQEGVAIAQKAVVHSGAVVANSVSSGPFLDGGVELSVGQMVEFAPGVAVYGDSVSLKQKVQLGEVHFNELTEGQKVNVPVKVTPLALPVVALPEFPAVHPGATDIVVKQKGTQTLDAGSYGLLDVGQKATIVFSGGGAYHFAGWEIGQDVRLYFQASSQVYIAGRVQVGQKSFLGPDPSAGSLKASDIVLYVAGQNGADGSLGATPKAAHFGQQTTVHANIYAPNGTLVMNQKTVASGAFLARWVEVGQMVDLTLDSAFSTPLAVSAAGVPSPEQTHVPFVEGGESYWTEDPEAEEAQSGQVFLPVVVR